MTIPNTLSKVFIFALGAAAGSFVTWKLVKEKYERKADEEIDAIKQLYVYRNIPKTDDKPDGELKIEYDILDHVKNNLQDLGYLPKEEDYNEGKEIENTEDSYVIHPDQYSEFEDYDAFHFTFYSDGVLTDSQDVPMDENDIADIVGIDFAQHVGEYEPDAVYIRNERLMADIEIFAEHFPYSSDDV